MHNARPILIILTILPSILTASTGNKGQVTITAKDFPELKYVDENVNPCDDFYAYACGNFQTEYPKPETGIIDNFGLLGDELIKLGNEILKAKIRPEDPVALRKAKTAYSACVNTEINEDYGAFGGNFPEENLLQKENGMPLLQNLTNDDQTIFGWNDIGKMVGDYGISLLFDYKLFNQPDNDNIWVLLNKDTLANPPLIRPDFQTNYDDFVDESFRDLSSPVATMSLLDTRDLLPFDIFLQNFTSHLNVITDSRKNLNELQDGIEEVRKFMQLLNTGGIVENDTVIQALSVTPTLKELQEWSDLQFNNQSGINWLEYMGNMFKTSGVEVNENLTLVVLDAKNLYGVLNLVRQSPAAVVKNFALLRIFLYLAPDSTDRTRGMFEDYYRAKSYVLYDRWEYCTRKLIDSSGTASLSFASTYDYQKFFYNWNLLQKAYNMTKQIHNVFVETVNGSNWMAQESKEAALRKAENMLLLLAFPDFVRNPEELDAFYENVQICKYSNYDNAIQIRAFKQAYMFSQIGKPRQRNYWDKSPFQVNAFYNRANNKIFLPISILNPPFFGGKYELLDFARLGSIIGHEITHGFDQQGHNYDENGYQVPWWTNETLEAFNERTTCFVDQYNQYSVPEKENVTLNGELTINENLADNGGIKQAYRAFKKVQKWKNFDVNIKDYTEDQLFFLAYGTMWCASESDEYIDQILAGETYSTNRFRVIGSLTNLPEFSKAFSCPTGCTMNREEKCVLW